MTAPASAEMTDLAGVASVCQGCCHNTTAITEATRIAPAIRFGERRSLPAESSANPPGLAETAESGDLDTLAGSGRVHDPAVAQIHTVM